LDVSLKGFIEMADYEEYLMETKARFLEREALPQIKKCLGV